MEKNINALEEFSGRMNSATVCKLTLPAPSPYKGGGLIETTGRDNMIHILAFLTLILYLCF